FHLLFTAPAPPEISPLSLHDALPIWAVPPCGQPHTDHPVRRNTRRARWRPGCRPELTIGRLAHRREGTTDLTVGSRGAAVETVRDRKSTRLNSSHEWISYAVFCLKKK